MPKQPHKAFSTDDIPDFDVATFDAPEFDAPDGDDQADNPLKDVSYTGNFSQDALAEKNAVQSAFAERAKAENIRRLDAIDSEYWVCLCFTSRAQKEEFLTAAKLVHLGEKYIDGLKAAGALGITIKTPSPEFHNAKIDSKWYSDFGMD